MFVVLAVYPDNAKGRSVKDTVSRQTPDVAQMPRPGERCLGFEPTKLKQICLVESFSDLVASYLASCGIRLRITVLRPARVPMVANDRIKHHQT